MVVMVRLFAKTIFLYFYFVRAAVFIVYFTNNIVNNNLVVSNIQNTTLFRTKNCTESRTGTRADPTPIQGIANQDTKKSRRQS